MSETLLRDFRVNGVRQQLRRMGMSQVTLIVSKRRWHAVDGYQPYAWRCHCHAWGYHRSAAVVSAAKAT